MNKQDVIDSINSNVPADVRGFVLLTFHEDETIGTAVNIEAVSFFEVLGALESTKIDLANKWNQAWEGTEIN